MNWRDKQIFCDFEFNGTSEPKLNLVCCSFIVNGESYDFWLHNDELKQKLLKQQILDFREQGYIFTAYAVEAEARSLIALGINPVKCRWIDLHVEYKMLLNHCHDFMYGKQLMKGKVITTYPPKNKWQSTEEERKAQNNAKPSKSMAAALYKMLGVKIDTDHKNEMRDLIISAPESFTPQQQKDITEYCASDVKYLKELQEAIFLAYRERINHSDKVTIEEVLWRGETSARVAMMVTAGYPINVEKTKKFASNIPKLLKDLCEDINSQFPVDQQFFKWNNSRQAYSMFQAPIKEWVKNSEYASKWMLTDKKSYSLSLDAFEKHFSYRHDFPEGEVAPQIMRYLKTRQSLNGFLPKAKNAKNKETFFDSLGSDGRVRSYLNQYGSQSARYQPKATSFLFLKSAWMRVLCEPPKGKAICAIDYKSEEFLISAVESMDRKMIDSYASNDVYLAFAKLAGAVPEDGTKAEYKSERDLFKSTCLLKGSPIRVKNKGVKNIEDVDSTDEVWDGEAWRTCRGSKHMGRKKVTMVSGVSSTLDHKILTNKGWEEVKDAKKKRQNGKVCFQNERRLQRPSSSWSEVWALVCYILRGKFGRKTSKDISKRWVR